MVTTSALDIYRFWVASEKVHHEMQNLNNPKLRSTLHWVLQRNHKSEYIAEFSAVFAQILEWTLFSSLCIKSDIILLYRSPSDIINT